MLKHENAIKWKRGQIGWVLGDCSVMTRPNENRPSENGPSEEQLDHLNDQRNHIKPIGSRQSTLQLIGRRCYITA